MLYYLVSRRNPLKREEIKWYAQPVRVRPIELQTLATDIESRTTLSRADVKGLLDAVEHELIAQLAAGNRVALGDLGSFKLKIRSIGEKEKKKFTPKNILGTRVLFRCSTKLRHYFSLQGGSVRLMQVKSEKDQTPAPKSGQ